MFERNRQSSLVFTMKHCVLLSLLFAWACVHIHGAPVEQGGLEQGSCTDPVALGAAGRALTKINQDRQEGYVFGLHRVSNVHLTKHEENGLVFYLTLDVVETNCSVLSKRDWKTCETRTTPSLQVYGQCKAIIYMNRVNRVERLYKYNCAVRPVPAARAGSLCPDCPSHTDFNNPEVQKTVSLSLDKYNKESGLTNKFALLKIARAFSGMAMSMYYNAEYSIQETTCTRDSVAENCPLMECEFAHKGFCKASHFHTPTGESEISVECEIFEPEASVRESKLHVLDAGSDHSHSDANAHGSEHDQPHAADQTHTHDHVHDHTKSHAQHDITQKHADNSDHHHTHDHQAGGHRHAHDHSHDHGHSHDHVHAHHAKAHDHSGDSPNHHHNYKHAAGTSTHEHDHEHALDHDHKHTHLHEHEHHHHHHDHAHTAHIHPEGIVRMLPALGQPVTLPSFPDAPAAGPEVGVTLPLKPDPQIPGEMEPTIQAFPATLSAQCPPAEAGNTLVEKLFSEDPTFKTAA